jgi:heat shock protein HslJ
MRPLILAAAVAIGACAAPADTPATDTAARPQAPPATVAGATTGAAADDGTYLDRIDPLGGRWRVERIGTQDFTAFEGWIHFSAGGFLNHGAGCRGGHPAFYRLDSDRLKIIRRESVRIGKCGPGSAQAQAAAGASEQRLGRFLDQASTWSRPDGRTLLLVAADGTRAVLTRPQQPHPELAGTWLIESIGGKPLVTERRPAVLSIDMNNAGAHADCNSMGSAFTIPAPGRFEVAGPLISTQIGCAPEDAAEDSLMMNAIASAKAYRLDGDRLVFTGGPGMALRRPPEPNRRLEGEYESCGNTLLGAYHEGPITLAIGPRTMRDSAGCTAEYVADGPRLSLHLGEGPACAARATPYVPGEPVGIGGQISSLAVAPPDGFAFDKGGHLILRTDRGHLSMCRKGSPKPFGN